MTGENLVSVLKSNIPQIQIHINIIEDHCRIRRTRDVHEVVDLAIVSRSSQFHAASSANRLSDNESVIPRRQSRACLLNPNLQTKISK